MAKIHLRFERMYCLHLEGRINFSPCQFQSLDLNQVFYAQTAELASCLDHSLTLKTETVRSFETSTDIYRITVKHKASTV
jgi:hypothetical protein